jgi:hypothetical protein
MKKGNQKNLTGVPIYYLISHSAELFLKSALVKRGITEDELKRTHGHNLKKLLLALKGLGVPVTDTTTSLVERLSEQHSDSALRYHVFLDNGKKTFMPSIKDSFEMLEELLMLTRISTHGV